ncbi:uncharacterized protein [Dermacentor albipictus]|uniref:uncharacterized protein isoform X3 n=1 Tax=Dermacentor albipictus TaxID=60249 RepID=UPI0038FD11EA
MTCCAFGCQYRFSKGKNLFAIPSGKRDGLRSTWLHRIGRENFRPTSSTRLCERLQYYSSASAAVGPCLRLPGQQDYTAYSCITFGSNDTMVKASLATMLAKVLVELELGP